MPESTPENPSTPAAPAEPTPTAGATPTVPNPTPSPEDQLGDAGKKAIAAERKRASEAEKQLAEIQKRLQEFEDKDKSELEKAQARLTQYEKDLATERTQRLRLQAATDHSIPADYLDLLTATDEDGLKVQAEKVAALVKANGTTAPAPLPGQGTPNTPTAPTLEAGAALYKSPYATT